MLGSLDISVKDTVGLSDPFLVAFNGDVGVTHMVSPYVNQLWLISLLSFSVRLDPDVKDPNCCTPPSAGEVMNAVSSTCSTTLDLVAPVKMKRLRSSPQPWLKDFVRD